MATAPAVAPIAAPPKLFHGTSETLAERILAEGIRPSPSGVDCMANPKHVYMIERMPQAIMFAFNRVMWRGPEGATRDELLELARRGELLFRFDPKKKRRREYDKAIIFEINPDALQPELIRPADYYPGETAYEGVVPVSALTRRIEIPITRRLEEFVHDLKTLGLPAEEKSARILRLKSYVGVNIGEHLGMRGFDLGQS